MNDNAQLSRREAIVGRLQWVDDTQRRLSRSVRRAPWALAALVVALPVGIRWGVFAAVASFAAAAVAAALVVYVCWAHQQEYAQEGDALRQALADLDRPPRAKPPWRVQGKALRWQNHAVMAKAKSADEVKVFTDIPNVGKATAQDFVQLGFARPQELAGQDPLALYQRMCALSNTRQDPCVLDVFLAVVEFMNGGAPKDWWEFTAARKKRFPDL